MVLAYHQSDLSRLNFLTLRFSPLGGGTLWLLYAEAGVAAAAIIVIAFFIIRRAKTR